MGRKNTIEQLPNDVLEELNRRIASKGFGYADHEQWLKSIGFEASKSAIHRYAVTYAARELEQVVGVSPVEVRLRCLESCASVLRKDGASSNKLIEDAKTLVKWVYSG